MFIRYFVELQQPQCDVVAALRDAPHQWLQDAASGSMRSGGQLSTSLGLTVAHRRVEREADVEFGEPHELAGVTVFPMTLTDHSMAAVFPRFEADLEVAALGATRSQLAINVRYQPPLGIVGAIADRALMHRVAEATVKEFMDRVARRIETPVAEVPN